MDGVERSGVRPLLKVVNGPIEACVNIKIALYANIILTLFFALTVGFSARDEEFECY